MSKAKRQQRKQSKKPKDHKLRDVLQHTSDKVRRTVSNMNHNLNMKVSHLVKDVKNAAHWLPLMPFKKGMGMILKARGYPVPVKLDDLAKSFFTHIVKKHHFEEYFTVHQAAVKLGRHSAHVRDNFIAHHFEQRQDFAVAAAMAAADIIIPIVKGIVSFFAQLKAKKAAGAPLPAEEEAATNDVEVALDNAGDEPEPDTPPKNGITRQVGDQVASDGTVTRPRRVGDTVGSDGTVTKGAGGNTTTTPPGNTGGAGDSGGGDDDEGSNMFAWIISIAVAIGIIILIAVLA